ncbi:head GIN domain-containing protein [Arenibacter sp. GZD96]|uniref:head GIN domain-containing protein n=1 Tax=Aurantibrevibacter litoralis TaxID=3106030 RepID=UPI002AFEE7C0|nr:head GIN domain-containing protein [Arenibacter sp. GZD-96]MEA1785717.1 head GIN domain-containing protein [Arenibacter sp. GZD-96]
MKKAFLFVFLFFAMSGLQSQNEKVTKALQPFRDVKVYDGLSVTLIKSNENKAVITGANTDKVAIVLTNDVLKIRMEITKIFSGYRTFIDLYYTDNLVVLDVNEDAKINAKQPFSQPVLELKAQEGGQVEVDAKVEQLLIKTVTGGVVTAKGSSDNQDVIVNTGGVYKGKDFKTKFTTVNVNAGSTAEIFASDYVKASVKAGGTVHVYGNPEKMEEKTVFGGKIIRM